MSAREAVVETHVDPPSHSAAIPACLTEDERAALTRELREEVGVVPRQVDPAPVLRLDDGELHLALWVVRSWTGCGWAHPAYVEVARRAVTGAG